MSTAIAPDRRSNRRPLRPAEVVRAAAAPLAGLALAYGLWWISDRLGPIGPLDRAAFAGMVVLPIWALTPFLAALAWQRLTSRDSWIVAAAVGAIVTVAASILLGVAIGPTACATGAAGLDTVATSLVGGVTTGAGLAAICALTTTTLRHGTRLTALAVGAIAAMGLFFAVAIAVTAMVMGRGCLAPPL